MVKMNALHAAFPRAWVGIGLDVKYK